MIDVAIFLSVLAVGILGVIPAVQNFWLMYKQANSPSLPDKN